MARREACPLCGAAGSAQLFSIPDRLHGVPGWYTYVRCNSCGSVFQNPAVVVEDLKLCYPVNYFTHASEMEPTFRTSAVWDRLRRLILAPRERHATIRSVFARVLRLVPAVATRARLGLPSPIGMPARQDDKALEIGPGRGTDLLRLRRLGWEVVGLEVDPEAAQNASRVAGCPVVVGDLTDLASLVDGHFGLVYSSHSFEHLPEPGRALEVIHASLRPGGRLVLLFPNCRSAVCRMFGADAVSWDPPRHLTLPTGRGVADALDRIGYTDIRVRSLPARAAHYSSVSRGYRRGLRGQESWYQPIGWRDRALGAVERAGTLACARLGEELVISAVRQ